MRRLLPLIVPAIALVSQAESGERRLKIEFDELAAKASAAVDTVNSMEQRAKDLGYSLNPDLIAQRSLVQSAMNDAEEALQKKEMDLLRERLERARGHINRLYKML